MIYIINIVLSLLFWHWINLYSTRTVVSIAVLSLTVLSLTVSSRVSWCRVGTGSGSGLDSSSTSSRALWPAKKFTPYTPSTELIVFRNCETEFPTSWFKFGEQQTQVRGRVCSAPNYPPEFRRNSQNSCELQQTSARVRQTFVRVWKNFFGKLLINTRKLTKHRGKSPCVHTYSRRMRVSRFAGYSTLPCLCNHFLCPQIYIPYLQHEKITWAVLNIAILSLTAFSQALSSTVRRCGVVAGSGHDLGSSSTSSRAIWPVTELTPSTINWIVSLFKLRKLCWQHWIVFHDTVSNSVCLGQLQLFATIIIHAERR